jgi:hypothetical protein
VKLSALLPTPPVEPGQEGLSPDSPGSSKPSGDAAGNDGMPEEFGVTAPNPGVFAPSGVVGRVKLPEVT